MKLIKTQTTKTYKTKDATMNKQGKKKRTHPICLMMGSNWMSGGTTQYKYSKRELFFLTQ